MDGGQEGKDLGEKGRTVPEGGEEGAGYRVAKVVGTLRKTNFFVNVVYHFEI